MIREGASESALELAAKRLERAVAALEQRLATGAGAERGDLFNAASPPAEVTAELERMRARERELETAGAEASAALGRAINEIRAALNNAPALVER